MARFDDPAALRTQLPASCKIREESLAAAVIDFGRLLKDHGLAVTTPSIMDALRGLCEVGVDRLDDVRAVLKATFLTRAEEGTLFDRLFAEFWGKKAAGKAPDADEPGAASPQSRGSDEQRAGDEVVVAEAGAVGSQEQEAWQARPYVIYSPQEILREQDFKDVPEGHDHRMTLLIRGILAPLMKKLAARRRSWAHGSVLDFRKLLRRSVRYGGEIFELPRVRPRPRIRRLVFLCDVSGSMNLYLRFMLRFIKELQDIPAKVETFLFATRLSRITPLLGRLPFETALERLGHTVRDWHGGTRIGACMHEFTALHGGSMLGASTVVLIFSDGWDRGDACLLESEITKIHLRSHRLIWINPLLGGPQYEPTCRGMKTVLPHVDSFLPGHNVAALERLVGTLRGMMG